MLLNFEHRLNELIMGRMEPTEDNEHPQNANALLVKELLEAFHRDALVRATEASDPYKSPRVLLPVAGLIITALINAGIMWAKVAALESKMVSVDSISVVAAQVTNLEQQVRSENEQLRASQQRLEDRIEKVLESQAKMNQAIR